MAKYPIFLELHRRRVVLIGAGGVALRKAQALLAADAQLVVVAKHFDDAFLSLYKDKAELIESGYCRDYLPGAVLVIAATNDPGLNERIYKDCQQLKILCNVVDEPELCDFFVPAVIERGQLQIAIGTEGSCPAYARHLRKKLEQQFTDQHGRFLVELQKARIQIIEEIPASAARKNLLSQLVNDTSFEYFIENGPDAWRSRAEKIISESIL